jgi:hypothetical protein
MATNPQAIAGALPELVRAEQELSRLAAERGIRYAIAPFGGVRSLSDTTRILSIREVEYKVYAANEKKAGRAPVAINTWRAIAPFGNSFHNYGAAFDVRPTTWPQGKTFQWAHDQLDEIARTHNLGLRSGDSFNDEPHFELAITLNEARKRWDALGKKPGNGVTLVGGLAILALLAIAFRKYLQ